VTVVTVVTVEWVLKRLVLGARPLVVLQRACVCAYAMHSVVGLFFATSGRTLRCDTQQ
jgi:hypothetical protein